MAGNDPRYFFDILDLWNRRVVCYRNTWDDHVIPGHAEMADYYHIEAAKAAISTPLAVTQDSQYADRRNFYGRGPWYATDRRIVKVVVRVAGFFKKPGKVITAYITTDIPPKETLVWGNIQ